MKILCIGPHFEGSTTKMRSSYITELLPKSKLDIINTEIPSNSTNRLFRSLGWRTKRGPLISNINAYVLAKLKPTNYDLIWIDKGVFIEPQTIKKLKSKCNLLVHFTPDPAFLYHSSHLFNQAISSYDFFITTKSFEIPYYKKAGANNIILCTQGFDNNMHQSLHKFKEKRGVVFLGHHESNRALIIQDLINNDIPVTLAGIRWKNFYRKNKSNQNLNYRGKGIYGKGYSKTISSALIGLGLLSEIIPEKHTTRTFEIPACGTALLTPRNEETSSFFEDDEAIFYDSPSEIVTLVQHYFNHLPILEKISIKGKEQVHKGGFDHKSIMKKILNQIIT